MNLAFSEDQCFIQDQANNFLKEQCTVADVRQILDSEQCFHQDLWRQMVDLGWSALSIPESYGGLGLGYLELCLIAESLGKVLAPVPFLSSVVLATEVIKACCDEAIKQEFLPKLASGDTIGCVVFEPNKGQITLKSNRLFGSIAPVFDGGVANMMIVAAENQGENVLCLVDLTQPGISIKQFDSMDPSKNIATVDFDNVVAKPLSFSSSIDTVINHLQDVAAVVTAFEQCGGAESAMKTGIDYTQQRYAFGRQVASFQAIKHKFSDMFVALELAKSNAYYAAWALSSQSDQLSLAAATARVSAIDAFYNISKENIEVHGGMGFTWEFDCHLYYRRAQYLSGVIGTQPIWQERLINSLITQGLTA